MRLTRTLVALGAFAGVIATPAWAAGSWTNSGCGGNSFQTCASVTVSWDNGGVVTVVATNTGSFGEDWFEVALTGMPSGWTGTVAFSPTDARYDDALSGIPNGAMFPGTVYGTGAASPPPTNGLHNGETGTWVFTFGTFEGNDNTFDAELNAAGWGIHAGDGPNACSTKLNITKNSIGPTGPYDANCTSVVPEPGSMTLLATGLIGLVGAGLVKRRKNS